MTVPYVHSGYARKENDDYQTIDGRCIDALAETIFLDGKIVDICASHGSGIVSRLVEKGYNAEGSPQAFNVLEDAKWIVTNPPYDRAIVDRYAEHAIAHVQAKKVFGAVFLMRANWDMASSRARLFDTPFYKGQIRMRFRPWWSEERKAQPIHNYVWHIWANGFSASLIHYWPTKKSGPLPNFEFQPII